MGAGAPDGSSEPSIVIEHKQCLTIRPSTNGNILFAIVPSPYGAIAVEEGDFTATVNACDTTAGAPPWLYSPNASVAVSKVPVAYGSTTTVNMHYPIVPFTESLRPAGSIIQNAAEGGFYPSQFRVLTTQAKVMYSGDSFHNSGVAATAKLGIATAENLSAKATYVAGDNSYDLQEYGTPIPQMLPADNMTVCSLPGARIFPVTESVQIVAPFQDLDYQNVRKGWAPFYTTSESITSKDSVFGGMLLATDVVATPVLTGNDPIFGIGSGLITFYAATGMDTTTPQAITIEIRCCVEYTLAYASPSSRFAMLPAPARLGAVNHAKALARGLPSSFPATPGTDAHGWLYNLGAAYIRTMRTIAGNVWDVTGKALVAGAPSLLGKLAGLGISGAGQAMLPSNTRLAIQY